MATPAYNSLKITREVAGDVKAGRFVQLDTDGKVTHATGGAAYGISAAAGSPESKIDGYPANIAVFAGECIADVTPADGEEFKAGDNVYVGAEGKAAKTGDVVVGDVHNVNHGVVRVRFYAPSATA